MGRAPTRFTGVWARAVGVALSLSLSASGCAAGVPEGKAWQVDTAAWAGSPQCAGEPCALDAYRTRDFTRAAALPASLVDGAVVQVHCFVPTPAPMVDPLGREAYRWYLLTADDQLAWAPDLALTSDADLRRDRQDPGEHLAAGVALCHSAVPGR
jgi:hypothetical protein